MKLERLNSSSTISDLLRVYNSNLDNFENYIMSLGVERKVEVFNSERNQTWYTLTKGKYPLGRHSLIVYVGGSICIAGVDFVETAQDSFRLVTPPVEGTQVIAIYSTLANELNSKDMKSYSALVSEVDELRTQVSELTNLVNKLIEKGE